MALSLPHLSEGPWAETHDAKRYEWDSALFLPTKLPYTHFRRICCINHLEPIFERFK